MGRPLSLKDTFSWNVKLCTLGEGSFVKFTGVDTPQPEFGEHNYNCWCVWSLWASTVKLTKLSLRFEKLSTFRYSHTPWSIAMVLGINVLVTKAERCMCVDFLIFLLFEDGGCFVGLFHSSGHTPWLTVRNLKSTYLLQQQSNIYVRTLLFPSRLNVAAPSEIFCSQNYSTHLRTLLTKSWEHSVWVHW